MSILNDCYCLLTEIWIKEKVSEKIYPHIVKEANYQNELKAIS